MLGALCRRPAHPPTCIPTMLGSSIRRPISQPAEMNPAGLNAVRSRLTRDRPTLLAERCKAPVLKFDGGRAVPSPYVPGRITFKTLEEDAEFEGDSPREEVAAQIRLRLADPVQLHQKREVIRRARTS